MSIIYVSYQLIYNLNTLPLMNDTNFFLSFWLVFGVALQVAMYYSADQPRHQVTNESRS